MSRKIKVLIVDDSVTIRTLFKKIFSSDPELEVVGACPDPYDAREKLVSLRPDVMTLDVEMPKMDGVTFLEKVSKHFPVPTIIISTLAAEGSEVALRAFAAGAVDVIPKPELDMTKGIEAMSQDLIARVKSAAKANVRKIFADPVSVPKVKSAMTKTTHQILAIASSTGGTEALKRVLPLMPADLPGTVIVQHMPPLFTKAFAEQLQRLCSFEVREAKDGDRVHPGVALIAPGNFHMELRRSGAIYSVTLHQQPLLHGVRPAADFLLKTVAKYAGSNAVGVVLTGMGKDGAEGLLEMKKAGSFNIAQSESTCVVYGMPKVAVECGAIDKVVDLDDVAANVISAFSLKQAA